MYFFLLLLIHSLSVLSRDINADTFLSRLALANLSLSSEEAYNVIKIEKVLMQAPKNGFFYILENAPRVLGSPGAPRGSRVAFITRKRSSGPQKKIYRGPDAQF